MAVVAVVVDTNMEAQTELAVTVVQVAVVDILILALVSVVPADMVFTLQVLISTQQDKVMMDRLLPASTPAAAAVVAQELPALERHMKIPEPMAFIQHYQGLM
jgi:hypothetical protein